MSRKWLPLAPMGTPGIWWQLAHMIPTRCGSYYPRNLFASHFPSTGLFTTATRAWCALYGNDSLVAHVGTITKLYLYDGASTITDVSKGGAAYTSTVRPWSFCQFGDVTLASNRADAVQARNATSGGNFADVAAAPKATILVTQAQQVLAFDINDGAEKRNAFATSAPGDYTDWTSASATTATPILHRPGRITAAVAFRDYVLVFKQSSIYKLSYTGSNTYKWRVECIAVGKGAWGVFDVVSCGEVVVFSGPGGVWKFDGASFVPISEAVGEVSSAKSSVFCPISQNVMFAQSADTGVYVYNLVSDRWGKFYPVETGSTISVLTSLLNGMFFMGEPAALRSLVSPSDALPDLTFWLDSAATSISKSSAYYGTSGYSGVSAYITTGIEGIGGRKQTRFGGLDLETTVSITRTSDIGPGATELSLRGWIADNKEAYTFVTPNTGPIVSVSSSTNQHRFDFQVTAPYGKFSVVFPYDSGYLEVLDVVLDMKDAGKLNT